MPQIDSVSSDDVERPTGKGPDELSLEASLSRDGEDPEERAPQDTDVSPAPESDGPSDTEGELPAEDPTDGSASLDDAVTDGQQDPEGSADTEPAPKPPAKVAAPPPPDGFASWEDARKAFDEARQWAEYGKQQYLHAQRATEAPQQRQEAPPAPKYSPPYAEDSGVRSAYLHVMRSANPEAAIKTLPGDLAAKVHSLHEYVDGRDLQYRMDPKLRFDEQIRPYLENSVYVQVLEQLQQEVRELRADRFVEKNASVLKTDTDRQDLAALLRDGVPRARALEHLRMKQELAGLKAGKQKVDDRARSQDATKKANRDSQAAKRGSGRTGVPTAGVKPSSDFDAMFRAAQAQEKARSLK